MRTREGDANPLLESAGGLALTQSLALAVLAAVVSSSAFESGVLIILSAVAGGLACGLVLLRRGAESRRWRTLGIIAALVIGVWILVSVPSFVGRVGIGGALAIGGVNVLALAAPVVEVAAAALVLYVAAARRFATTVPSG
jgi:hypothetical protein